MKGSRILIVLGALLAESQVSSDLWAQTARSVSLGVIGGAATTALVGKDAADDLERRTGAFAGVSAVFSTPSRIQVELDGLYATKGWRSLGSASSFDFTVSYIEVPVLLRLSLAPAARARPFVAAGPAFGIRIGCGAELTSAIGTDKLTCADFERTSNIEVGKTDLSGVLGAGVEFPIGSTMQSTLAARYSRGFSSVLGGLENHFQTFGMYVGLSWVRRR